MNAPRTLLSAITIAMLVSTTAAFADGITFTLLNPTQSIAPGQTVIFNATITASSGNAKNIYLNSDNSSISDKGSVLSLNDSDFFSNFPLFLTPTGASDTFTGALFTITNGGAVTESYTGSFNLLGGANGSASTKLGTVTFGSPVVAASPEPSSFMLLASGLGSLTLLWKRRIAGIKNSAEGC